MRVQAALLLFVHRLYHICIAETQRFRLRVETINTILLKNIQTFKWALWNPFWNVSLHFRYEKPEQLLDCEMICVCLSFLVCLVVYQNCIFLCVDVAFLLLCCLKVELIVNIRYALSTASRRGSKAGQGIRPSALISREKHLYLKGQLIETAFR